MTTPKVTKALVNTTLIVYVLASLAALVMSAADYGWINHPMNGNWMSHRVFILISFASTICNTIYFSKRGFNLQAISTFMIGVLAVPLHYVMYANDPGVMGSSLPVLVLSVVYMVAFLFYGLSFVLTRKVRRYNYLKLHGIAFLVLFVFTVSTIFIYVPNWSYVFFGVASLVSIFMIMHFIKEQEQITTNSESLLDNEFLG